jgi:hypothetical protein
MAGRIKIIIIIIIIIIRLQHLGQLVSLPCKPPGCFNPASNKKSKVRFEPYAAAIWSGVLPQSSR